MNHEPTSEDLRAAHQRMRAVAERLRLPLRHRAWKGAAGNWLGVGIGSSIDFQDHRPYLPGDDPRYIDWLAYARTGLYTMKLYREEVSPRIDLIVDATGSMWANPQKTARVLDLFYFCFDSALRHGGAVRCYLLQAEQAQPLALDAVTGYGWSPAGSEGQGDAVIPPVHRVPRRHGALRVFISDLLYPGPPEELLRGLTLLSGRGLVFAPYLQDEERPPWSGNVELLDCETGERRRQRVAPDLLRRYRQSYARHFTLWQHQARRYDVPLARVPAEGSFVSALQQDALSVGAVEPCL